MKMVIVERINFNWLCKALWLHIYVTYPYHGHVIELRSTALTAFMSKALPKNAVNCIKIWIIEIPTPHHIHVYKHYFCHLMCKKKKNIRTIVNSCSKTFRGANNVAAFKVTAVNLNQASAGLQTGYPARKSSELSAIHRASGECLLLCSWSRGLSQKRRTFEDV